MRVGVRVRVRVRGEGRDDRLVVACEHVLQALDCELEQAVVLL